MNIRAALRSKWLYTILLFSFLLSPRMWTSAVWNDYFKPTLHDATHLHRVTAARFLDDGDLEACVALISENEKVTMRNLILPLRAATDPNSEFVRMRTKHAQQERDNFKFELDESILKPGCSFAHDPSIFLQQDSYDGSWLDHDKPILQEFDHELLIGSMDGPSSASMVFLTRRVLRRVELVAMGDRPAEFVEEHFVEFSFSPRETGWRFLNAPLFIPSFLADALIGPFGWILVLNQHRPR